MCYEKEFQELRSGDIFKFRDRLYVCLMCFTDKRHMQTVITAIAEENSKCPLDTITITGIRGFRTSKVIVVGHVEISIETLHLEEWEITDEAIKRLAAEMSK